MRLWIAGLLLLASIGSASAEPLLRDGTLDWPDDPQFVPPSGPLPLASTNVMFLNRCPNGCTINVGSKANSINDTWPISSQRVLSKFAFDDATWNAVVACVKDTFEPYNLQITDVDPGTASHFEIMIAGVPADVGFGANIGGVAPPGCSAPYLNNALVFDFANVWSFGATTCNANCIEDICSTAAQEIGHTWADMDHSTNNKDPMTYLNYTRRKYFQDADQQCGSDCVNGQGPQGETCSGTNNQSHVCRCTGGSRQTQNSYQVVKSLFGVTGSPPTMVLTPDNGTTVDKGFSIKIGAMDNSGTIARLQVKVDGTAIDTSMIDPFAKPPPWTIPTMLENGPHTIQATVWDPQQSQATAMAAVQENPPCNATTACPSATDACVGGRCVPGPSVTGGLGTTCNDHPDCASGQCATDGTNKYCVETCTAGQCPQGFGCLDDGAGNGFCWPGYDEGGGGCGCQSNRPGGALTLGLLFAVGLYACRRRRR